MHPERGNILFLILLAVILFAALSYAVTSSLRGGGTDAGKESLQVQVAHLQNIGMQMRIAIERMRLMGRYETWQIDYSGGGSAAVTNATCTTANCKLHDPAGGGVNGTSLPEKFRDDTSTCPAVSTYLGQYYFRNVSLLRAGIDDKKDLFLMFPGVSKSLCMAINDANDVPNPSGAPPVDTTASSNDYTGTLSAEVDFNSIPRLGDQYPELAAKQMFCSQQSNSCYHMFFMLLER